MLLDLQCIPLNNWYYGDPTDMSDRFVASVAIKISRGISSINTYSKQDKDIFIFYVQHRDRI